MENNILIMSLSSNLENNIKLAKKNKKEYKWENRKFDLEEYEYLTKVYLKELQPNKIIVFGTDQSSWNYLYDLLNEYFDSENKKIVFEESKKNDIEYVKKMFEEKFSNKCKIFFMKSKNNFDNENIISDLIFQIEEIKNILDEQTRNQVYVDITGGLRIMFMTLLSIVNVLKIHYNQLNLKVLYSQNDVNSNYFEILDITNVLDKLDYVDAISSFTKYGSIDKLRKIVNKNLLDTIEELYIRLQFNQKKVDDVYKKLIGIKSENENGEILKEKIKELRVLKNEKYHNRVKNYGLEIINRYENSDKKDKNLKNKRDKIVHPLNKIGKDIVNPIDDKKSLKKKILIWNLGTGEFGKGYEKILYKYLDNKGEEEIVETQYTFEPYIKEYDKIYIFGIRTGKWEILTEYFKNKNIELPNDEIKYVFIDNFGNIDELYMKIKNEIENPKKEILEIDMDITHSFREVPFNLLISLRLFELLNDNIVLNSVYYGEKIFNQPGCGSIYEIPILGVINLYKSIIEFRDYTKYTSNLRNSKMINENLLEIMEKISEAYTYNEYKKVIEINKDFEKINEVELDLINRKIYEIIKSKLIKNDGYDELIKFLKNQNDSKNYALTLFFLIDIYKYRIFKIDSKEKSENFYKKIEKLKNRNINNEMKKLINSINELNDIRNDAGHFNNKEKNNIEYFFNLLNEVINNMNKLTEKKIEKYEEEYNKL